MDLSFSQRNKILPDKKKLQMNSMDSDLKNAIWNILLRSCFHDKFPETHKFFRKLWDLHFKLPIDEIPLLPDSTIRIIKKRYMEMKYNQVYDFLEFIRPYLLAIQNDAATHRPRRHVINNGGLASDPLDIWSILDDYEKNLNNIFEREFCGYRLVGGCVTPITSEHEMEAIEVATKTSLSTVNKHIQTALKRLSDRDSPDYRNSIKESISAVESICKNIADDPGTTMSKALKKIEEKEKIEMHPDMKEAFKKLYHYTSDSGGIRHALMDQKTQPSFDDAKFMLVSCSAFINYLVSKAAKSGINLNINR